MANSLAVEERLSVRITQGDYTVRDALEDRLRRGRRFADDAEDLGHGSLAV